MQLEPRYKVCTSSLHRGIESLTAVTLAEVGLFAAGILDAFCLVAHCRFFSEYPKRLSWAYMY